MKREFFNNVKVQLLCLAVIPVLGILTIAGFAWRASNKQSAMLAESYEEIAPSIDILGHMGMQRARVGYFIWAALANEADQKSRDSFIKKAHEAFEEFKKNEVLYSQGNLSPESAKNYESAKNVQKEFYQLTESLIKKLEQNTKEANAEVYVAVNGGAWHKMAITYQNFMAANMKLFRELIVEKNAEQKSFRAFVSMMMILVSLSALILVVAISFIISNRIIKTLKRTSLGLQQVGTHLSGSIDYLSEAGQGLSQSTTASAASLEETVASLEEMSSVVKMNSDNSKQAAALSQSSRDNAEKGYSEITQLIGAMKEISDSSRKIEEIIGVIDDIAFQTNLLALNAAVEAARAGEQGKGFAVVAEAVRSLAQRSAVAAKDISSLIRESVEKVDNGALVADKSGLVLQSIVDSVKKVADLNNEIAAASAEQATGIQQISKAMNQLDQSSQSNASSSGEIASTAQELKTQASSLQGFVVSLSAMIESSSPAVALETPVVLPSKKVEAPVAKVLLLKSKKYSKAPTVEAPKKSAPIHQIPFDDEEELTRKVGSTEGF